MAVNITDATTYIETNVIDVEDWTDSDDAKKQRILTVAERVLSRQYSQYTIPDEAVYEYTAVLAVAFNDTNKQARNGVKSFSIAGISFNFEGGSKSIERLIPQSALDLIGDANGGIKLSTRRVGWTVL